MAPKIWVEPHLTIIARPYFMEPAHLLVQHPEHVPEGSHGERLVEFAGRLCYMSQANHKGASTRAYLSNILQQGHGSVLEHANYSMLFEGVSRSFTHELVRHRAGWAYSQLSQRYVDESDTGFVAPPALLAKADTPAGKETFADWVEERLKDVEQYRRLSDYFYRQYESEPDPVARRKMAREAARSVLPNATETKIVATGNARAWRTMLELRCALGAEKEMRRAMLMALQLMKIAAPGFFADFRTEVSPEGEEYATPCHHKV